MHIKKLNVNQDLLKVIFFFGRADKGLSPVSNIKTKIIKNLLMLDDFFYAGMSWVRRKRVAFFLTTLS